MKETDKNSHQGWREWRLVYDHFEVTDRLREAVRTAAPSPEFNTIFLLIDAIQESTNTLLGLVAGRRLRDAFVIARVIYETAINACFVLAGGSEVAERAWRHARQKALRDLDRRIKVGGEGFQLRWSGAESVLSDPENRRLLEEFTSKAGREMSAWTTEGVTKRLETILGAYPITQCNGFLWGLLLYRHASEIAHGSLFGALYCYGATDARGLPRSFQDLLRFQDEQCQFILLLVGSSLRSLVQIVGSELGAQKLQDRSDEIYAAYLARCDKEHGPQTDNPDLGMHDSRREE